MILSLFILGGFFEFSSCIISAGLIVFLLGDSLKNKRVFECGINTLCIMAITIAYLLSIIMAVDRGMAFIGFVKYMPLIPLVLIVSQLEVEERRSVIKQLPILGVIMTALSGALSLVEPISDFLNVNGNLAGFFQYPNTFAMFLVMGLIVIAENVGENKKEWIRSGVEAAILLLGILLSGSRTSWVILVILHIALLCRRNTRQMMKYVTAVLLGLLIIGVGLLVITGRVSVLVNALDLSMSTFYGRLLYVQDALGQVLLHPLGLGYWGYFFTQGSFQTGVYAVLYVHNDFLQLFLDAGWIAGVAFIVVIVRSLRSKEVPKTCKMILIFASIFMMFDFHLQYISIFIILLLCMDYSVGKRKVVIHTTKLLQGALVIGLLISIYFGVALSLKYLGLDEQYMQMYPYDTEIMLEELSDATTVEESNAIADKILAYNTSISAVYGAKAEYAYSEYDFQAVSEYKLMEISLSPYTSGNYRELIDMMNVGMLMYEEVEDTVSAAYCKGIILQVPDMLEELNENTSYLGTMIDASPYRALSDEYIEYLESLE